jgi:hypothetical protein
MYTSGYALRTSADFDNAMYFGLKITVWQNGGILDYGGSIQKHNSESVVINSGYYLKAVCEFKVR